MGLSADDIQKATGTTIEPLPGITAPATTSSTGIVGIRGQVSSAGSAANGSGFTSSYLGGGVYQITFTAVLTAVPVVVVSPQPGTTTLFTATLGNPATTGVQVVIHDAGGGLAQCAFDFLAMLP